MITRNTVACPARHTTYQPTDAEWRCPKCGEATPGEFYIEDQAANINVECDLLHQQDLCYCNTCEWGASGQTVAKALLAETNRVPCPHCHGTGFVPKKSPRSPRPQWITAVLSAPCTNPAGP